MSIFFRGMERSVQQELARLLENDSRSREQFALVPLWRNWDDILGPLAGMVHPLGHKDETLVIGVEDSAMQQEMHYYGPMILENVNAFLEKKVFDKVRVELLMGKTPLTQVSGSRPKPRTLFQRPENLGQAGERIPPDSPVGRSYRAYVRMFDRLKRES